MYIDQQEPEFIQRYKVMDRAQFGRRDAYGRRPYPLRDLDRYDVNRFGQLPVQSGIPPWVLWLAVGLLIWFLFKSWK